MPLTVDQEFRCNLITSAQSLYFVGLLVGYVAGQKKFHPTIEGWNQSSYEEGPLAFIDEWGDNGGRVLIAFQNVPVWLMRYEGKYKSSAIPCLRAALKMQAEAGKFNGGRGPSEFMSVEGRYYFNKWRGNFEKFSGEEGVQDYGGRNKGREMGGYEYWGGMLL